MEWLTGGAVLVGFHEVVVTEGTVAAAEASKAAGRSMWRVSSTVFTHVASANVSGTGGDGGDTTAFEVPIHFSIGGHSTNTGIFLSLTSGFLKIWFLLRPLSYEIHSQCRMIPPWGYTLKLLLMLPSRFCNL